MNSPAEPSDFSDIKENTILVLGATGLMGSLVADLIRKRLPDVRLILGARGLATNEAKHHRRIDINNRQQLRKVLVDVGCVINAVGPYDYDPTVLLEVCGEQRSHYVDLAEAPEFIDKVKKIGATVCELQDEDDRTGIVTGCSTVPAMIEAFAHHWSNVENIDQARIYLAMGSANPVTPALVYSLLAPLAKRSKSAFTQLDRRSYGNNNDLTRLFGRYPFALDTTGLTLWRRVVPATFWISFDRDFHSQALWLAAKILPWIHPRLIKRLCNLAQPFMPFVQRYGDKQGFLVIEGVDKTNQVVKEVIIRAEENGLNVPALPSTWAAEKLLCGGYTGVQDLRDLMNEDEMVESLEAEGYPVSIRH
ncbi:MAG: saccharopine dehydrogenase NADP-binding domain-containing protein [Vampirovibrio sp.]|nr:saccharopine dehydrogenase NADP-binding domain-containing protein [Vampirovibrio sp.]